MCSGMNQVHLRLLFKTCVIPVLTYGCQLWYRPDAPKKGLLKKLQVVQNAGLRRIAGAFRTTPVEALPLLTFQPPLHITIQKLCDATAIRLFRLPVNSEVTYRLPLSHVTSDDIINSFSRSSKHIPIHIPFRRPTFLMNSRSIRNLAFYLFHGYVLIMYVICQK